MTSVSKAGDWRPFDEARAFFRELPRRPHPQIDKALLEYLTKAILYAVVSTQALKPSDDVVHSLA
jgi:hypothetical protein